MSIQDLYSLFQQASTICTDTRKISPNCLFFALKGENFDANDFAEQAVKEGASFAIVDKKDLPAHPQFIFVDDVLETLQDLAHHHRKVLGIPVIGLTGTNGKTTTKELINAILSQKFKTSATLGNLNNHIGVPLTLLAIGPETEIAIVEMGANHQKEIEQLSAIVAPNYGLITNVGKAHLEGFGGFEGVKKGKGELYSFLEQNGGTVFINRDNPHLMEMANKHNFKEAVYYGESGYVSGELTENNPFLSIKWSDGEAVYLVKSQLTGIYNFENLLAGITIGKKFGLSADEINRGIESYTPQNNRSQIIKTERNTIIGDFYNANPTSMLLAIENIAKLDADKKVLILGDMFELGDESLNEHRAVIEKALFFSFEKVIFLGKEFSKAKLLNDKAEFFDAPADLVSASKLSIFSDALILLKGSRGMKLEQLLEHL